MKHKPTSGPNPQQQEAIHITEGPLLIIAGSWIWQDLYTCLNGFTI